jgi:thiamine-monophosphate kinase
MRVSEIGEFGLIRLLCREFGIEYPPPAGQTPRSGLLVDIGDDALAMAPHSGATVWTTDTLVAGMHFLPGRTSWRNTGWKAIAVNVSDIAAMGAMPAFALVTLCLPSDFCVEDAIELYRGMKECCDSYAVRLGGGDIVRSPVFAVTVALSGLAAPDADGKTALLSRRAARPGDVVAVSGALGDSAGGLELLQSGAGPDDESRSRLIEAHERPRPRVDVGRRAAELDIRCGMDVSDGLVQDLGHIVNASKVCIRIDAGRVPLSQELRRTYGEKAIDLALTGGEDYQLLLCGRRALFERLVVEGLDLTIIGEVIEGQPRLEVIGPDGREMAFGAGGWDHFRSGEP